MSRHYTVERANRTLPYVGSIVREVRDLYAHVKQWSREHNRIPRAETEQRAAMRQRIQQEASRIHECQEELWQIGAELKDYEMGLVDFPAKLDGRSILLCWKYGEESVAHWHDPQSGFSGRKSIPEGVPSWPTCEPAARG